VQTGAFYYAYELGQKLAPAMWHSKIDRLADPAYFHIMSALTTKALARPSKKRGQDKIVSFKDQGTSLGLALSDTSSLIRQIEAGFSFETLLQLVSRTGVNLPVLASLIGIPERTLARRKIAGKLAPEESERLLRISRVFEKAVNLFEGDLEAAVNWLTTPKKALGNEQPLSYARTEVGAREVENLLGRIEHGVFS
jgi:putative toxin-antitoxin system antitoxin component (TIGR02293 family)